MNNTEDRAVKSVVIDPGHGGSDAGAVGNNMLEKGMKAPDFTLLDKEGKPVVSPLLNR